METSLAKIKKFSIEKESENWEFRAYLKNTDLPSETIDSIVHELYAQVSSEIDCKSCANCCRVIFPVLDHEDIKKLSTALSLSSNQFKDQYTIKDNDSNGLVFKKKPCPFLSNNLCSYYNIRPKECVAFPYLNKSGFTRRLIGVIENYAICPIVFNVYELLKKRIWK